MNWIWKMQAAAWKAGVPGCGAEGGSRRARVVFEDGNDSRAQRDSLHAVQPAGGPKASNAFPSRGWQSVSSAVPAFRFSKLPLVVLILLGLAVPVLAQAKKKPKPTPKPSPTPEVVPPGIDVIEIATSSFNNPKVPFYVRPPAGFSAGSGTEKHRLVLLFPFVPESGLKALTRNKLLTSLADARGWFIASPTFVVDFRNDSRDRTKAFYYPERWSGKAVLEAVAEIEKKYPVDGGRLFVQGLSGGAQIAHRLGLWCPERITAVAVNSSGWFDDPGPKASQVAWAVTVGEADPIIPASVDFVEKLKARGAQPVFKAFIGMVHEDYPAANQLCAAFLLHMDELTKDQLGQPPGSSGGAVFNRPEHHDFVGDRRDYLYFSKTPEEMNSIPPESRFLLPDETVAEFWGEPGN